MRIAHPNAAGARGAKELLCCRVLRKERRIYRGRADSSSNTSVIQLSKYFSAFESKVSVYYNRNV